MAVTPKDLLKRTVELDKEQKYSEALICYEEGIQRAMKGRQGYYRESINK